MLGKNHSGPQARAIGTVAAFADAIETVAGSNDPCVRRRALAVFAKVFKHRRVLRGKRGKIVDGFLDSCSQACGGDIVAQDSAIDHLGEESRPGNEFAHEMRDVSLALRRERLLVARSPAKRDDDYLSVPRR